MQRIFLILGSAAAGIAVVLGAFGAHALKEKIPADQLQIFETGVRYQFYHAFALLILGLLFEKLNPSLANYSGCLFLAGIIFFCGSLYLLSLRTVLGIESWKFLGPITPLGGLCFIAGWFLLAFSLIKNK